jgi:hypothetical protein
MLNFSSLLIDKTCSTQSRESGNAAMNNEIFLDTAEIAREWNGGENVGRI